MRESDDCPSSSPEAEDFQIGAWRISPRCNEISAGGDAVRLEPRTMAALRHLAASPGQVVTREQLEAAIWPGMVVGYDALSNTIARLRKALGDDPRNPRFIETIPRVGYRLIVEVGRPSTAGESGEVDALQVDGPDRGDGGAVGNRWWVRRRLVAALAGAVIAVAAGLFAALQPGTTEPRRGSLEHTALPAPARPSIAVLPFVNMSDDPDQAYFSDGLADDLITHLSRIERLFVVSRSSTFVYKDRLVPPREIGAELGVEYVLEGSVRRAGGDVRINARLIDADTGGQLWAERYDGKLGDIFALQDRLVRKITQALSVTLAPDEEAVLASGDTASTAAYEAFLKGWERFRRQTPEDFAAARRYFEEAITIDPGYSRAYGALAALYWEAKQREWYPAVRAGYLQIKERAFEYLEKARDEPSAIALATSARIRMAHGDYEAAIAAAERAVDLAPSDADARNALAQTLIYAGQPERALAHITRSMRLDPLHQSYPYYLRGLAAFGLQRFDAAATYLSRALELNPEYRRPAAVLAAARAMLNQEQGAASALQDYLSEYRKYGVTTTVLAFPYRHEADRKRLAEGLRRAGMPELDY